MLIPTANRASNVILASSSPYRKQQLLQLNLEFTQIEPNIDESSKDKESPRDLALRLATEKAFAAANSLKQLTTNNTPAVIIAGDQTADLNGQLVGKPATRENAISQLSQATNQEMIFHSALCVLNTQTLEQQTACIDTCVKFRDLTLTEITRYIEIDNPLGCAGSFKIEAFGISLFQSVISTDPSALIGLPLITLVDFLKNERVL